MPTMFHIFKSITPSFWCHSAAISWGKDPSPIQPCKAILREMWEKIRHCMAQCIAPSHCGTSPDLPPYFYDLTTLFIGTYFANTETKCLERIALFSTSLVHLVLLHCIARRSSLDPSMQPPPGFRASMVGCVCSYFPPFSKRHDQWGNQSRNLAG